MIKIYTGEELEINENEYCPEKNLHPKEQVKWAKEFIERNIHKNMKFSIKTHSPYIVKGLEYHARFNNILDKIEFYYNGKKQKDIEKIFKSFVKPLDSLIFNDVPETQSSK